MSLAISKQTDRQITVALKEQTVYGVIEADASPVEKLRFNSGGLNQLSNIETSGENRDDGQSTRGDKGRNRVEGSFIGDVAVGAYNVLDAAVMRSTWTADQTVDETDPDMSSATISVSAGAVGVVTASAGSWITAGFRVGQVVQNSEGMAAADQNVNMFITALTASAMSLVRADGTAITVVAGPVATYTFVIKKNVIRGTTDCIFTVEEYRQLLTESEVYDSVRCVSKNLTITPDQKATTEFGFLGRKVTLPGARHFSPGNYVTTSSLGLSSMRAKLVLSTGAVVGVSGISFSMSNNGYLPNEIDEYASEIGVGNATVEASISLLEADLTHVAAYIAGTQQFVGVILEEPDAANPKDFMAFSMTNVLFGSPTKTGAGADRFSARTIPLIVGSDDSGGAADPTMVRLSSSV